MTRRPGDPARERAAHDVDAELAFHHDRTVEELTAAGLSHADAVAEARRRFGPQAAYRRRLIRLEMQPEAAGGWRTVMNILVVSARSVLRDARRAPAFTLGVLAILTLGLGLNAITFGLVDRLLLRGPEGLQAPEDLRHVIVHRREPKGAALATMNLGYLDYLDLKQASVIAGAAAESRSPLMFGSGEGAETIEALLVTAEYFPLLGAAPAVGRFFTADESARQGLRLVVLGHAFWERRFGGDPSVIGQVVAIETHRYTIVGVAPRHFTGTSVARVDVFLPLEAAADELVAGDWRTTRNFSWMRGVVRLSPGASDAPAEAQITTLHRQGYAKVRDADPEARIELEQINALRGMSASDEIGIAALVGAVAVLVLVIAVANASNLFLARSLRRRDRVAVRMALGGARWRLIAEHAVEGALLALAGAGLAIGVAWSGAPAVRQLVFPEVAWMDTTVDARLLIVLGAIAVCGGAVAAALPMWQIGRTDVVSWLRTGVQRGPRRRTRTQAAMIVVQGTLSVVLLVFAGLFVRSLADAEAVDLGVDTDRVIVVSTIAGDTPVSEDFRDRLRARIEKIPGVERTTRVAGTFPFVSSWATRLAVAGLAERPRIEDGGPYLHAVEPGYFQTVGTTIVEGRPFTPEDRAGAPRVVIVNQTMARLYWPGASPIGKCLHIGSDAPACSTVIGVAENTRRQEIVEGDSVLYYVPLDQATETLASGGRLIIRTSTTDRATVARLSESVRRQALELAPGLRHVTARSLDDVVSPQLRTWRLGAALFSVFGVLALTVATIGLYSVIAFDVEGRRRELGLRSALGATTTSLLRLVVGDGLRMSILAITMGLTTAWLLAPLVSGLLFQRSARDTGVYAGVAAALLAAAVAASALPGHRAAHVDPGAALRDE